MFQETANPLSFCIHHIYLLLQISNVYFTNRGLSCFTGGFKKHVRFLFVKKKDVSAKAEIPSWAGHPFGLVAVQGWCVPAPCRGWSTKGRCCFAFSGFSSIATILFFFICIIFLQRRIQVPQDWRDFSRKGDVIFLMCHSYFHLWFDSSIPFCVSCWGFMLQIPLGLEKVN